MGGPSGLATPIFSFSLSSLEPKSLRMVILIIILVQVLCCHLITKITRNGINGAMFVTPSQHPFLTLLNYFPSIHSSLCHQSLGNDKFNAACGEGVNSSSPMSTLLRQPSSPSMLASVDSGVATPFACDRADSLGAGQPQVVAASPPPQGRERGSLWALSPAPPPRLHASSSSSSSTPGSVLSPTLL